MGTREVVLNSAQESMDFSFYCHLVLLPYGILFSFLIVWRVYFYLYKSDKFKEILSRLLSFLKTHQPSILISMMPGSMSLVGEPSRGRSFSTVATEEVYNNNPPSFGIPIPPREGLPLTPKSRSPSPTSEHRTYTFSDLDGRFRDDRAIRLNNNPFDSFNEAPSSTLVSNPNPAVTTVRVDSSVESAVNELVSLNQEQLIQLETRINNAPVLMDFSSQEESSNLNTRLQQFTENSAEIRQAQNILSNSTETTSDVLSNASATVTASSNRLAN